MSESRDVVISAPTAAGKTEAAFLPALSKALEQPSPGIVILYISPLKALINDQFRRLESLGKTVGLPFTPWHGDVPKGVKDRFLRDPTGTLQTTPESLESLLLNKGPWCGQFMRNLRYVIIDEFHSFVGSERGRQLQSLLHRLDFLTNRLTPRIALSATIGDLELVAHALRPPGQFPFEIIASTANPSDIKILVRGYIEPEDSNQPTASEKITEDLFKRLRGGSHLAFANSRKYTEYFAHALSDRCQMSGLPNEFFPHHGSLSREVREPLEERMQENNLPTTAVCTMTLELGIDIGHVESIAQIEPPQSVASARQRLGRSGRRSGDAAIMRFFISEAELSLRIHLGDLLRLKIFQVVAIIELILRKWCEPADTGQYHFSTLVQQTLSVIGQYGGVRAKQLWSLLCGSGPFSLVSASQYSSLLRGLGENDLITQTEDGQLVLGQSGESLVSHYTFYAAFQTPEEYILESEGKRLGTLPITQPLRAGDHLIFAGRKWEIIEVFPEKKLIALKSSLGGAPPLFSGQGQLLHDRIRQEMFCLYKNASPPAYLDRTAKELFNDGLRIFQELGLKNRPAIEIGKTIYLLPWLGDKAVNAIASILTINGVKADSYNGVIDLENCSMNLLQETMKKIIAEPKPSILKLTSLVEDTLIEKHDRFVPAELRALDYGSKRFDLETAWNWLTSTVERF
jgi:ATP-dependent Lhr-like helicase